MKEEPQGLCLEEANTTYGNAFIIHPLDVRSRLPMPDLRPTTTVLEEPSAVWPLFPSLVGFIHRAKHGQTAFRKRMRRIHTCNCLDTVKIFIDSLARTSRLSIEEISLSWN